MSTDSPGFFPSSLRLDSLGAALHLYLEMSSTVSTEMRRLQLSRLIDRLRDLVATLSLDDSCEWAPHFRQCVAEAERLSACGFTQEELTELSVAITQQSGLLAYCPGRFERATGCYEGIPGTENFETFARATFECARDVRAIS